MLVTVNSSGPIPSKHGITFILKEHVMFKPTFNITVVISDYNNIIFSDHVIQCWKNMRITT